MSKRSSTYLKILLIAVIVIVLDQLTKLLVRTNLAIRETWMPIDWLEPYFRFIHWKNTGVAFGLFPGMGWIFTLIGLIVILLIIFLYKPVVYGSKFWPVALGLQLGGAIGNLLDRINPDVGYVVDFIWIGNFPVFNLADMAIVFGALIMLIGIWRSDVPADKHVDDIIGTQAHPEESPTAHLFAGNPDSNPEKKQNDMPEIPWHGNQS